MSIWLEPEVSREDRALLRDLARQVADIASSEENLAKKELWRRHNRLEKVRPLVRLSPEGCWEELLPESSLRASSKLARYYEMDFRKRLYYVQHFKDDCFVIATAHAPLTFTNTRWGLELGKISADDEKGAWAFDHPLKTPEDAKLMKPPKVEIDEDESLHRMEFVQELLGDILDVKQGRTLWHLGIDTYLADTLVAFRGNARFLEDMYDRPQWVHEVMDFMTDSTIDLLGYLEKNAALELDNGAPYDGMGCIYETDELPKENFDGKNIHLHDLWGNSAAQEFFGVSPEMHYEFGLQYQIKILERFGLNSYGCCEPLDRKIEYVKMIPNLRRVSISPWADVRRSAEGLQDKYIFSWKPNPACLVGRSTNTEQIRADIRRTVEIAQENGCILEMILKDTNTVNNQPDRLDTWARIALEEACQSGGSE